MSDGGQTGMCELHGPIYEAGYCRVCASMSSIERVRQLEALRAVPPVMQRARSEAQFNVVGDELRKLTNHIIQLEAQLTALRADAEIRKLGDTIAELDTTLDLSSERIVNIEAAQQLIMQKLEGLRADADKERAASEKEAQGRYERMLTLVSVLQDSTYKRLDLIVGIVGKRDAARKKKQERKRVGAKR